MPWGYISAYKLDTERALLLPVSISLKAKAIRSSFRVPRTGKYCQVWANRAILAQNHDARKAVWSTLTVLKWSGAIFQSRSSTLSVRSFYLGPFHWKLRPSGVSLESPGLKNIPQVSANRGKVVQNHDARNAISATFSALKWSGLYFGLEARHRACAPFASVHFT